jgi:hypothetical protein
MSQLGNVYSHLTNNSIVKHSSNFDTSEISGCMWSATSFIEWLSHNFSPNVWVEKVYPAIRRLISKCLQTVGPNVSTREGSFQVFGFDVMLDD